ncbi:hypothetical protein NECHADRAFT_82789 [Paecilomyces variotii No. 5]|uniref:Zn(2)-C6 fungal-type domain-containing protein n=1 Tax=Byssochlamys spectabilis (strain No. 5 / NBRC 109023) TaxID=1356009 RepID=V5GCP1_BYSSN|nr:hypothetical protein NECHADRAFT_82789 [Paecilomyces variotii No. 5]
MPRVSARSRGCRTCLKAKVKCDEAGPVCSRCARLGKPCTGPIKGPVIVDMSVKLRKKHDIQCNGIYSSQDADSTRHTLVEESSLVTVRRSSGPDAIHFAAKSPILGTRATDKDQVIDLNFPPRETSFLHPYYKSLIGSGVEQLCIAQFISTFAKAEQCHVGKADWMRELPQMASMGDIPALKHAIRAASMACYANTLQLTSLRTDACRWYTVSLNQQNRRLSRISQGNGNVKQPTLEDISAWSGHIMGAVTLCKLMGPEVYCSVVPTALFRTIRIISLPIFIFEKKESFFGKYPWTAVPFSTEPKTPLDELMDLMHYIPNCLALYNRNSNEKYQCYTGTAQDTNTPTLALDVHQLNQQLEEWESEFMLSPHKENNIGYRTLADINLSSLDSLPADTAIATINAAYVILHSILVLSGSSQPCSKSKIISSADAILNASDNLISDQLRASTWVLYLERLDYAVGIGGANNEP